MRPYVAGYAVCWLAWVGMQWAVQKFCVADRTTIQNCSRAKLLLVLRVCICLPALFLLMFRHEDDASAAAAAAAALFLLIPSFFLPVPKTCNRRSESRCRRQGETTHVRANNHKKSSVASDGDERKQASRKHAAAVTFRNKIRQCLVHCRNGGGGREQFN